MSMADLVRDDGASRKAEEARDSSAGGFGFLPKALQHWMNSWPDQETGTNWLRPSHMYNVCPREFVLNYWQPKPNRSFDWKSRMLMEIGTRLHSYVQNRLLGPMGLLYGAWYNKKTGESVGSQFHPDPDRAMWEIAHQEKPTWVYTEPEVQHDGWRIIGHLDGFVCSERMRWVKENQALFKANPAKASKELLNVKPLSLSLLELKTTSNYVMEKLATPKDIADYYKMQAVVYQHLTGIKNTVFWYLERDGMASEVLLFPYDKGWWNDARRKAETVWTAIRDETLPTTGMACRMHTDKRAKSCIHRDACWMTTLNFKLYVERGKALAKEQGRELLDLSGWKPPDE